MCAVLWCLCQELTLLIDSLATMGQRLHEDDSQVRLKVVFAGYAPYHCFPNYIMQYTRTQTVIAICR